jgi:L-threonylcarbamoyladenylate synthase
MNSHEQDPPAPEADAGQIREAAQTLRKGGLVAFPTETVYGLGASALDPIAVARVFEKKGRPRFDPLIVHLAEPSASEPLVLSLPSWARELAEAFWPGPLTLVLPKKDLVPDLVTAGLPSVGLRVPQHPIARALLREVGVPLAAPSANRFGGVSPTTAAHVLTEFPEGGFPILDGGPCPLGLESTVVGEQGGRPQLLRHGSLPVEELSRIVGDILERPAEDPGRPGRPAPGMLSRHYAPCTELVLAGDEEEAASLAGEGVGLLSVLPVGIEGFDDCRILAPSGVLTEAAAALFAGLRELDAAGHRRLVALGDQLGHAVAGALELGEHRQ